MASSSHEMFEALYMLAEVASSLLDEQNENASLLEAMDWNSPLFETTDENAPLLEATNENAPLFEAKNEPSVFKNGPIPKAEVVKIQKTDDLVWIRAKNNEQLSVKQIQDLSGNHLVDMFAERQLLVCNKRKKYCFQCNMDPDHCTRQFKSCDNEKGAKYKIKAHLFTHVQELAEKESFFSVLHDHHYVAVLGKPPGDPSLKMGMMDPFFQTEENAPLSIPTLPFPFVYVPTYPDSFAAIQEVRTS